MSPAVTSGKTITFCLRSVNFGTCGEPGGACGKICVRSTSRILPSALRVKASRISAVSILSLNSSVYCDVVRGTLVCSELFDVKDRGLVASRVDDFVAGQGLYNHRRRRAGAGDIRE